MPDPDDVFNWIAHVPGPKDTPYEGGLFKIAFKFPKDYPFKPHGWKFITKIYHPDVEDKSGALCVDFYDDDKWSPAFQAYNSIPFLLDRLININADDPLNMEAA